MTGMERLQALLSGQQPDRIPINVNLVDQGAKELGLSLQDYYAKGERVAQGQLRMRAKYGYDMLLGMFYSALDAELMGCRHLIYAIDGPPNVGHLVVKTPDDIKKLNPPADLYSHPRFHELASCIKTLKQESAGQWPVVGVVTASFSLPAMLMGVGGWLDLLLNGDAALRELLLQKCAAFASNKIMALKDAGADLIIYNNPLASATFILPTQFHQLALPWVLKDLEQSGPNGIIFFNGGGVINPILADLKKHTGIGAYYLNPFDDIVEARQLLGPEPLIIGAINDIKLIDWTAEEIEQEVERIMLAGHQAGRFIFGTLVMPYDIPEDNIRTMIKAAITYGCSAGRGQ